MRGNETVLDRNIESALSNYGRHAVAAFWRLREQHNSLTAERKAIETVAHRRLLALGFRNQRRSGLRASNARAPSELAAFFLHRLLHEKIPTHTHDAKQARKIGL